jgi:mannose/cellobiose epimerase-like protein (N-acyl-D-glucosamine 2-epimerase family)
VLVTCFSLLAGAAAGCSTTQEKAEKQQARAKHILEARAERQRHKKKDGKQGKSGQKKGQAGGSTQ